MAVDGQGRLYVTDVLNGRVQRVEADGRSARPVVKYGVSPGEVFRPSGVDVADDRLWVADSVLGVVQVFTLDGQFIDAVRDANGEVLHLDAPLGIEVIGDRILVVESGSDRATELRHGPGSGARLALTAELSKSKSASEGQECTLCHLDMMPPLDEGIATALVAVPDNTDGESWAGREEACVSCHDGSVLDSRAHIWSGYAHPREDAVIPTSMVVPPEMPLVNGKISCRTCHSPHSLGGSAREHRGATMLRVDDRPSELCVACHGPMGGM